MKPAEVDLHIHTKYCPCAGDEMMISAVVEKAVKKGLKAIGFVPHSYPIAYYGSEKIENYDIVREKVKQISEPDLTVFMGAEVESIDSSGRLLAGEEIAGKVQYILAAPDHYHLSCVDNPPEDKQALLDYHHRTIMNLLDNPLVSAIAHPYKSLFDILPDLRDVLESYFLEEAQKARETGKAIELNGTLFLSGKYNADSLKIYERFVEILAREKAMLFIGSDSHLLDTVGRVPDHFFNKYNIPESLIWLPEK